MIQAGKQKCIEESKPGAIFVVPIFITWPRIPSLSKRLPIQTIESIGGSTRGKNDFHSIAVVVDVQHGRSIGAHGLAVVTGAVVEARVALALVLVVDAHQRARRSGLGIRLLVVVARAGHILLPDDHRVLRVRCGPLGIEGNVPREGMVPTKRRCAGSVRIPTSKPISCPRGGRSVI